MQYSPGLHYKNQIIVLNRGNYTTCTINIHGATVTSWRFKDEEQLFVSRLSQFSGLTQIRGGIAFVFPHFGRWNLGQRHGFARNLPWKLDEGPVVMDSGDVYAQFSLRDDAYTDSMWNYRFKLLYKITLYERKLEFQIFVENLCNYFPFEFCILQHSLFKVPDVTKCEVIGFKDCLYRDRLKNNELLVEDRDEVTVSERTDRIYKNAPEEVLVKHIMNDLKLQINRRTTRDVNLWNPWIEQASEIKDLGNDEYIFFIAVEAGLVMEPLRIEPMTCWRANQVFQVVEPKKVFKNFYELFEGYC